MTQGLLRLPRLVALATLAAFALVMAACGSGSEATPTAEVRDRDPVPAATDDSTTLDSTDATPTSSDGSAAEAFDFPTGEPVLVSAGYEHPGDRVDNTGAYLPANGKPTVVFVDAIW